MNTSLKTPLLDLEFEEDGFVTSPVSIEELGMLTNQVLQDVNRFESMTGELAILAPHEPEYYGVEESMKVIKERIASQRQHLTTIMLDSRSYYSGSKDENKYNKMRSTFEEVCSRFEELKRNVPKKVEQSLEQSLQTKKMNVSRSTMQQMQIERTVQEDKVNRLNDMENDMDGLNTAYADLKSVIDEQKESIIISSKDLERCLVDQESGIGDLKQTAKTSKFNKIALFLVMICLFLAFLLTGVILFFIFLPKNK